MGMRCQCLKLRDSNLSEFALESCNMQVVAVNLQNNTGIAGCQTSTLQMDESFI